MWVGVGGRGGLLACRSVLETTRRNNCFFDRSFLLVLGRCAHMLLSMPVFAGAEATRAVRTCRMAVTPVFFFVGILFLAREGSRILHGCCDDKIFLSFGVRIVFVGMRSVCVMKPTTSPNSFKLTAWDTIVRRFICRTWKMPETSKNFKISKTNFKFC